MGSKLEETEPLPLGLIDDSDPIQRIEKLANRLISVLDCLQAMLVYVSGLRPSDTESCQFSILNAFLLSSGGTIQSLKMWQYPPS